MSSAAASPTSSRDSSRASSGTSTPRHTTIAKTLPRFDSSKARESLEAIQSAATPSLSRDIDTIKTTLTALTQQCKEVEKHYNSLPPGPAKNDLKTAILNTYTALANTTIDKGLLNPITRDNFTSFFTDTTIGKLAVATYIQADAANKLPVAFYKADLLVPTTTLFDNGLLNEGRPSSSGPTPVLSGPEKLALLTQFTTIPGEQHPLQQRNTYTPFVADQQALLLENREVSVFENNPTFIDAAKQGLATQIRDKLISTPAWITELNTCVGQEQWRSQFNGFETELLTALCDYMDKNPRNNSPETIKFVMGVAEASSSPEAYKKVLDKLTDAQLSTLIGPNAEPDLKEMVSKNNHWKSEIGARLEGMSSAAQQQHLETAMNLEIKLPSGAKAWTDKLERTHVGQSFVGKNMDFMISPNNIRSVLAKQEYQLSSTHPDPEAKSFCRAVNAFCQDPHKSNASINELYQRACQLEKNHPKPPLELAVRIALAKGIHANLQKATATNISTADLGSQKWRFKAPIESPAMTSLTLSSKSRYSRAAEAFSTEKKVPGATPQTLSDWVDFSKHYAAVAITKYTDNSQKDSIPKSVRPVYSAMAADATAFETRMTAVKNHLETHDIAAAKKELQTAIAQLSQTHQTCKGETHFTKASIKLQKHQLQNLEEMIRTCRRLNKGIDAMLQINTPKVEKPPAPSAAAAIPTPTLTTIAKPTTTTEPHIERAYEIGLHAKTPDRVDTVIRFLETETTASQARVTTEKDHETALEEEKNTLTTKKNDLTRLQELKDTIIPTKQGDYDAAVAELGVAPDPIAGTPGSGLLLARATETDAHATATTQLGLARTMLETHKDTVTQRTEQRDRLTTENETSQATIIANAATIEARDTESTYITDVTIPALNIQQASATTTGDRLAIDLANKHLIDAIDSLIAPLRTQIVSLNGKLRTPEPTDPITETAGELDTQIAAQRQALQDLGAAPTEAKDQLNARIGILRAQLEALPAVDPDADDAATAGDTTRLLDPERESLNTQIQTLATELAKHDIQDAIIVLEDKKTRLEISAINASIITLEERITVGNPNTRIHAGGSSEDPATIRGYVVATLETNIRTNTETIASLASRLQTANERLAAIPNEIAALRETNRILGESIAANDIILGTLNADVDTTGSILNAERERAASQVTVDGLTTQVEDLRLRIVDINGQIQVHEATKAAYEALIHEKTTLAEKYKRDGETALPDTAVAGVLDATTTALPRATLAYETQATKTLTVTTKETALQGSISERSARLKTHKSNLIATIDYQRQTREAGTFLGNAYGTTTKSIGDTLQAEINRLNPPRNPTDTATLKDYQAIQAHLQTGNYGEALKLTNGMTLTFDQTLHEQLTTYVNTKGILSSPVKNITLSAYLKKAEELAGKMENSSSKDSLDTRYIKAVGTDTAASLRPLLQNETSSSHREAIRQLDTAIGEIQLAMDSDPKTIAKGQKYIESLTKLKAYIDAATRNTATSRSDKMGQVDQLRNALSQLSDTPLPPPDRRTNAMRQHEDFFTAHGTTLTPLSTSSSATALIPAARGKLEKMGLLFTPETPVSIETMTGDRCDSFLAMATRPGYSTLFQAIKTNDVIAFKQQLQATNISNDLTAWADRVDARESKARTDLATLCTTLSNRYATLNSGLEGTDKLKKLDVHSTNLQKYLTELEASGTLPNITDPNEQKLLCELGICLPATPASAAASTTHLLYDNRPLTQGLLDDLYHAHTEAANPAVIDCMRTTFRQAMDISNTSSADQKLMSTLCEDSAKWSSSLWQHPWKEVDAATNSKRLQTSIGAYDQLSALREKLSLEVIDDANPTQKEAHTKNLENLAATMDHLFLDIQRGLRDDTLETTANKDAVISLTAHTSDQEKLKAITALRPAAISKTSPSATKAPVITQRSAVTMAPEFKNRTSLHDLPGEFPIMVNGQRQTVTRFYPMGESHSKNAALSTLFGIHTETAVPGSTPIRSVFSTTTPIDHLKPVSSDITDTRKTARFAECMTQLQTANPTAHTKIAYVNTLTDSVDSATINSYLDYLKTTPDPISSQDILFLSELYEIPMTMFTYHSLGTEKLTWERTCVDSKKPPIQVAVSDGHYERWTVGAPPAKTATRVTAPVLSSTAAASVTRTADHFGTAFSGNTAITCWLEAYLYATAYGPNAPKTVLRETSDVLRNPEVAPEELRAGLRQWKSNNPERAEALIMLSDFLTTMATTPTGIQNITPLDKALQNAFFKEAWRQQDATDFNSLVMGTLSEIMKAANHRATIFPEFTMARASTKTTDSSRVQTSEMQFMAHESLEFRINLHHEASTLAGKTLSEYLIHQDEAGIVNEYEFDDFRRGSIQKGQRQFKGTPPTTCQIQMMSAKDDYSFQEPAAHTATPEDATTNAPFITIPIEGADPAHYMIGQVIVRSGSDARAGHYTCYFKQDDVWYIKTSNGNPATKVAGGFPDIFTELSDGGKTYTYYGELV
jgi:hypothetical protein